MSDDLDRPMRVLRYGIYAIGLALIAIGIAVVVGLASQIHLH